VGWGGLGLSIVRNPSPGSLATLSRKRERGKKAP
jgi:hypothetical protein